MSEKKAPEKIWLPFDEAVYRSQWEDENAPLDAGKEYYCYHLAPEWVSVEERLPKDDDMCVIIYLVDGRWWTRRRVLGKHVIANKDFYQKLHWLIRTPLPAPPEEDK